MDDQAQTHRSFTRREIEVLRLLALGFSHRDIAQELVIAPETARWYIRQIYEKLEAHGRVQALNQAKLLGLLDAETSTSSPKPTPPKHNLPVSATTFIGRRREISEVVDLLRTCRLLTLTGVGGVGKTRLALEAAKIIMGDFADGVTFVDLAVLSIATLVAKAIADTLGIVENAAQPLSETLKRALAERQMLLVVDNFEHVVEAAPLLSALLSASERLKILVTSREPLRLSGEQEYPVPLLTLPAVEGDVIRNVMHSEAGLLFVRRAQMIRPRYEASQENAPTIAEICVRLDGLPLAIELAAARCKLLSPDALLSRLNHRLDTLTIGVRDAPPRQRTLRSTLEWSYSLLNESERHLFARLAVFQGGFSLDAALAVCSPDLDSDLLDIVASLVDKNLVQQKESPDGELRFTMLETIHEFAWEQLDRSGESERMRRIHAEYFVGLAERAEPELRLADQRRWLELLASEQNNIRVVLEWSLGAGEITFGVRLVGALYLFWYINGSHIESWEWIQRLLPRLDESPTTNHPKFLNCAGCFAMWESYEKAERLLRKSLEISYQLGDDLQAAWALTYLPIVYGEPSAAAQSAEEGIALFKKLDYKPGLAQALHALGELARSRGDDQQAMSAYETALALAQENGDNRLAFTIVTMMAFVAQHDEDYRRAMTLSYQGLALGHKVNYRWHLAIALRILAGSLGALGEEHRAAVLLGVSDKALERMSASIHPVDRPEHERIFNSVRARLSETEFEAALAEGRKVSLEEAVANALSEAF